MTWWPQAQVYVCEKEDQILGFLGLMGDLLAGLFVKTSYQNQGLGQLLLAKVKENHDNLQLKVYRKNSRAIRFYQKAGFKLVTESFDPESQEQEWTMEWKKE